MPSALNNTSADASNASNAVDFDSEDEETLSKHAPSSLPIPMAIPMARQEHQRSE